MKWFGFLGSEGNEELPDLFPLTVSESLFIEIDLKNIFARILTDTLERTEGLPATVEPLLWDSCLKSDSSEGLVTMIATAMINKADLFIVYDRALNLIRKAKSDEQQKIREAYLNGRIDQSPGVYVSFHNFHRADMLKIYSALEYCAIASLNKSMNVSKAIQFKINDLRASTALVDSAGVKDQASRIAAGLKKGKDVSMDAKDIIEVAKPDISSTEATMNFISQKRSFYLGLPSSWITGLAPKGLGDTGEGDQKAIERGLKSYFFAIVKPVCEALFKAQLTFKSEDFYGLNTALQALKDFEITDNTLISEENKLKIINKLFGLPNSAKGDDPEVDPAPAPAATPPATPPPPRTE